MKGAEWEGISVKLYQDVKFLTNSTHVCEAPGVLLEEAVDFFHRVNGDCL